MGVIYDLNEIHEPGLNVISQRIPLAKGEGREKGWAGPASPPAQDPLEQRVGVIPVDAIPGNMGEVTFWQSRCP